MKMLFCGPGGVDDVDGGEAGLTQHGAGGLFVAGGGEACSALAAGGRWPARWGSGPGHMRTYPPPTLAEVA